jgi:hypothetical protein
MVWHAAMDEAFAASKQALLAATLMTNPVDEETLSLVVMLLPHT